MKKISKGRIAFNIFNYGFLTLLIFAFLIPYYLIFIASFTDNNVLMARGYSFWPGKWSIDAYVYVMQPRFNILSGLRNSVFITVCGTLLSVAIVTMASYSLSRKHLVGRGVLMKLIVFSMLFSGGLIPSYLLISNLNLLNTFASLILPTCMMPWHLILMRNYFFGLTEALEEAAKIDGANHFKIFFIIYLPLSIPSIATITLFTAVIYWNMWSNAMLYLDTRHQDMYPIALVLRNMLTQASSNQGGGLDTVDRPSEALKMATVVISTVPIIAVYPFLQKYFITGITSGAVKE